MIKDKIIRSGYFIIPILHVVGIPGMVISKTFFIQFTPLLLLLCFGWIVISDKEAGPDKTRLILLALAAGFAIELVGVGTGKIFGIYWYGNALGPKIAQVPPLIGINWCMLLLSTTSLVSRYLGDNGIWIKSLLSAGLMTVLDFCMEHICDVLDMWYWGSGEAGLRNFIVWYGFSTLLSLVYFAMGFRKSNPAGIIVFALQIIFFSVLWALHGANIFL